MIEKLQKWIALLVTLAFVWLLPLTASPAEQAGSASIEKETGFVEQPGAEWSRSGKRNATLILFVGIIAVSFLLLIIRGINFDAAPDTAAAASSKAIGVRTRL